jgi:GDPmannose 4,6-dehydratase
MGKTALITGITGQDGSYLAEYLLGLGYEVHGLVRRVAMEDQRARLRRIENLVDRVVLHPASLESYGSIEQVLSRASFDECYHLAAQSFVAESFADGFSTMNTNINGTHYLLEALRQLQPRCRFYFAGSSEMFGNAPETPQRETTPFCPRSPYGISKLAGYHLTRNYREAYGLFCCSGILFNHESPRRGLEFVTRKITSAAARIRRGLDRGAGRMLCGGHSCSTGAADRNGRPTLLLGTLDARRDWGHAADYVPAMHRILQQPEPDDFVIATGVAHTVREFCALAFAEMGLDYRDFVIQDERLLRPAEVDHLVGDTSKAQRQLGWQPRSTFEQLVREMVHADLRVLDHKLPEEDTCESSAHIGRILHESGSVHEFSPRLRAFAAKRKA